MKPSSEGEAEKSNRNKALIEHDFQSCGGTANCLFTILDNIVFGLWDLTDKLLFPVFRFLDWQLDRNPVLCHCAHPSAPKLHVEAWSNAQVFWTGLSHTLYEKEKWWSRRGKNSQGSEVRVAAEKASIVRILLGFVRRWTMIWHSVMHFDMDHNPGIIIL